MSSLHGVADLSSLAQMNGCSDSRQAIQDRFRSFFAFNGFRSHPPGGLVPLEDKSVRFTGSTISTLKPYLGENEIPRTGVFIIQDCLRTQNAQKLLDDAYEPGWSSLFKSIGALVRGDDLNRLSQMLWNLFTTQFAIPLRRMRIRASTSDVDLMRCWSDPDQKASLEVDTRQPVYYTHKFGIPGVSGRNCNLAIVPPKGGDAVDVGNLIVIERDGKPIAVEAAFGIETIVSRMSGFRSAIQTSLAAEIVPIQGTFSLKLADALAASVAILNAGVRPSATSNRGRILRAYLQGLSHLRARAVVSLDELLRYAAEFERRQFSHETEIPSSIVRYVELYEELRSQGLSGDRINAATCAVFANSPAQLVLELPGLRAQS